MTTLGQTEMLSGQSESEQFSRRMLGHTLLAGACATAGTVIVAQNLSATLSVALGAALGCVNLRWLGHSLKAILSEGPSRSSAGTALKMIWRYLLIFVVALAAIQVPIFRLSGILVGVIAVTAGTPLIEAVYRLFQTARGREV